MKSGLVLKSMKKIDDNLIGENKTKVKDTQGFFKIVGAKKHDPKDQAQQDEFKYYCSSEGKRYREKHKTKQPVPMLHGSHQKFKTKLPLNPLKYPYIKEIISYLESVDQRYMYSLKIDKDSLLFAVRAKCVWKLCKLQDSFNLSNETFIMAVHLFDRYMLNSFEYFVQVNTIIMEENFNLRNFIFSNSRLNSGVGYYDRQRDRGDFSHSDVHEREIPGD